MVNLACGQEITQDTTLVADLTCTNGPALIIAADNVTLDLAGFTVSGDLASGSDSPGILFRGVHGSTVRDGTVQHFAAGVAIQGGGRNLVQNVTTQDNIGGGNFGDGIVIDGSTENRIEGNTVLRNGPYSGITLLNKATHNDIRHNIVMDNNMSQAGDPSAGRQDMGIRIEGPGASHNKVESNTITGSGGDGITVLPVCTNLDTGQPCVGEGNRFNRIINNTSNSNGVSGRGDGIKMFCMQTPVAPSDNTIVGNFTNNNTTYGVCFDARCNKNEASGNSAHGNGQYDGYDANDPPCETNEWEDNDFLAVNQPCVGGPKTTANGFYTNRPVLPGQAGPGSGQVSMEMILSVLHANLARAKKA
ncbi:MAG: right-handed parallel beta-helix repeat-containing protein [Actinomycetota bacterium]|nr:right-handed parallel beta-helix repeat-containing protein [Actinomycetota bacterium]